jgi:hypothetical protein
MKVVILYRPNSEHASAVEAFVHDFQARYSEAKVEVLNIDERDGSAAASLYEIMDYPAIMVLRVDGQPLQIWQGSQLPLMDEVASYLVER